MTDITPDDFSQFRAELGETPESKASLDILENTLSECDWNLDDATTLIAMDTGELVLMTDSLLEDIVERSRKHLCQPEVRKKWSDIKDVLDILKQFLPPPAPLVFACLFKLWEIGLRNLCQEESGS